MAKVLAVNLAHPRPNPDEKAGGTTGIDKRPTDDAVAVRAPGPMDGGLGSGLVGDTIGNHHVHGGDDQAVYAYAREDLDTWETAMHRQLGNGVFGENVTTTGVDSPTRASVNGGASARTACGWRFRVRVFRAGPLHSGSPCRGGSRRSPAPRCRVRT